MVCDYLTNFFFGTNRNLCLVLKQNYNCQYDNITLNLKTFGNSYLLKELLRVEKKNLRVASRKLYQIPCGKGFTERPYPQCRYRKLPANDEQQIDGVNCLHR